MRRISRGTPYVLTTADIENVLGSLTPRIEEAVASLVDMTVDQWRKQSKAKKAKQLVDFQNRGLLSATLASAAKAQTDLEEAAFIVTQASEAHSVTADVAALREMVAEMSARMDALTGKSHKKGA